MQGRIVNFNGRIVHGWTAVDLTVDVFLDDIKSNIQPRYTVSKDPQYHDFHMDIGSSPADAATPKIVVKFAGTDIPLDVAPRVAGFVNPVEIAAINGGILDYIGSINDLPSPPQSYIDYIGSGAAGRKGFLSIGFLTFVDLVYYGMLSGQNRSIVDLGCGCGRVGLALGPYLRPTDQYTGFDTWAEGVQWAREHVTTRYPNITFQEMPPERDSHRHGYQADQVAPIELPNDSVDSVFAMSVFTHLRMPATVGYLKEIFRILKPGGRAMLTWFLCAPEDEWIPKNIRIDEKSDDGYFTVDDTYVDSYFFEGKVLAAVQRAGFETYLKQYGFWHGERPKNRLSREGQDMLILVKPG
jgi:SAM-dependent methyltransferase